MDTTNFNNVSVKPRGRWKLASAMLWGVNVYKPNDRHSQKRLFKWGCQNLSTNRLIVSGGGRHWVIKAVIFSQRIVIQKAADYVKASIEVRK